MGIVAIGTEEDDDEGLKGRPKLARDKVSTDVEKCKIYFVKTNIKLEKREGGEGRTDA